MNHHFVEHAGSVWQVWACKGCHRQSLEAWDGEELALVTKVSQCRCLGVVATVVEQRWDRRAQLAVAAVAVDCEAPEGLSDEADQNPEVVPDNSIAPLAGLYNRMEHGAVSHTFSVQGFLCMWIPWVPT